MILLATTILLISYRASIIRFFSWSVKFYKFLNKDETYSSGLSESKHSCGVNSLIKDLIYCGTEVRVNNEACLVSALVFLNQLLDFLLCECKV